MELLKFVPIKLTLLLIIGILIGFYAQLSIPVCLIATAMLLLLLGITFRKKSRKNILFGFVMAFTTISMGMLAVSKGQPKNNSDHYSHYLTNWPQNFHIKIHEVLKSNAFSDRYVATILNLDDIPVSGKLVLNVKKDTAISKLSVDDELISWAQLAPIKEPLNPHQFNYKDYMGHLGVYDGMNLTLKNHMLLKESSRTIYGIAADIRTAIISKLASADFGPSELGIIQAILLGQRNDIDTETYNNYKNAGAVHILAVSGLHIGILLLLLHYLLRPIELLPRGKSIKLICIVIILWCFAIIAGLSASIIRAVTMFSFVAYAMYLNRPSNTFNILALSMFFILLVFNPLLLFQVGFQMSYAAVFAIVWIYPLLQKLWYPGNIIFRKGWQLFSVGLAAQLGVLPISLYYFHQFPGLFFLSNLLVVPFLGIILGTGILVILLALVNILPNFIASFYNALIQCMNGLIDWIAAQEAFLFSDISFDSIQLILCYTLMICLVLFFKNLSFSKLAFLCVFIIGFQAWSIYSEIEMNKKEKMLVLHQTRNSILFYQADKNLQVLAGDTTRIERLVRDFKIAEKINHISYDSIQNAYYWKDKSLLILDSLGIYPTVNTEIVVLTNSPKIHLDRLIDSVQPKIIIADGSNYKNYVARWQHTCKKRMLAFHYTGELGAYYFK